jgi:hypothetical protein
MALHNLWSPFESLCNIKAGSVNLYCHYLYYISFEQIYRYGLVVTNTRNKLLEFVIP